jgi:glycosyltransferase involved in cell wall biosynthesis
VIPPHDYGAFRSAASDRRTYDVVLIGAAIPAKRLVEAATLAASCGFRTVAIARHSRMAPAKKQSAIIDKLATICETHVDLDRDAVAKIFGASKYYLSLSSDESCSLAIYEALNAGCVPVVLNTGSAREQIGDCGFVVDDPECAAKAIGQKPRDGRLTERGMRFDRATVRGRLRSATWSDANVD